MRAGDNPICTNDLRSVSYPPMSSFKQMGFLSPSIDNVTKTFAKKHAKWRELYFELNKFAVAQFHKPQIENDDIRSLLIYSCYYRILTVYQSVYLLIERGSDTEGKALLRNLLETVFVLKACIDDDAFAKRYIRLDEQKRMKFFENGIALHEQRKADNLPSSITDEKADEMRKTVADYKKKAADTKSHLHVSKADGGWDIKKTAEAADLTAFYKKEYAYLCKFTHPSPVGMAAYLITDASGRIKSFQNGPSDIDAEGNMHLAIVMMFISLSSIGRYFGLPVSSELQSFNDKLAIVVLNSHTQQPNVP